MGQQSPDVLRGYDSLEWKPWVQKGETLLDTVEAYSSLSLCLEPQVSLSSKEPQYSCDVCVPALACVCIRIYDVICLPQPFSTFTGLSLNLELWNTKIPTPKIPHYFHSF